MQKIWKKPSVLVPCSRHNMFATAACKREKTENTNEQEKNPWNDISVLK